ncbi:MAG TPA: glycosyl hydrolase [Jatrophihabitans sp.]|jgi:hypothetical protein|uniref:glycoside hydrolase family 26 protein n=1 Tax=Jatrophihabitans sp. TaxID=1932789 RepID=UPI002DFA25ED|nr:glycosyl hydrolase [Jatrophihabitans sp.]
MRLPARLIATAVCAASLALGVTEPALATTAPASTAVAPATVRPPAFALGAYADGFSGAGSQLAQFETQLGNPVTVASSFRGWGDLFPDATQQVDSASGHTLLVAWDLGATADTRFRTFTGHAHDDYLAQEAATAAAYGKPLYIRPWAEMNGDWSAFQPTPAGDRPAGGTYAEFVAAWRYVVTFFRTHGATNVRWVFNPTTDTYAGTTPVTSIWPGAGYVDVLGLDGYNWGTGGVFTWRGFGNIYATQYARLTALAPTLPVWVCETGSKEPTEADGAPIDPAHSKAAWYRDMVGWLAGTHVRAVVMFDVRKERDWRIASDPAALTYLSSVAATAPRTLPSSVASTATVTVKVVSTATVTSRIAVRARVGYAGHYATRWGQASASVFRRASATVTSQASTTAAATTLARTRALALAHASARTAAAKAARALALAVARHRAQVNAAAAARRAARTPVRSFG